MFIGHFAVGLAAKKVSPRTSLGTLFFAAQYPDLLWPVLSILGVEHFRIAPGNTVVTPLDFYDYPISHSLLAVIGWAVLLGGIYYGARRSTRGAAVVAACVLSHWLLDAVVHRPDLPLWPGSEARVGLNLWRSAGLTAGLEGAMFAGGIAIYCRSTAARDSIGRYALAGLIVFLALVYAANLFGPPPPGVGAVEWASLALWLLIPWAAWADRHRRPLLPG